MELYASMVENLDDHVGRLIDYLKTNDLYESTLIVFMSDNGAAAEDFYERSDNRQTKSQMSWGVAAAFAAVGYQLLVVDGRGKEPNSSVAQGRGALDRVDFEPQIELGRVGFRLSRRFF